jgi:hypothetical protein
MNGYGRFANGSKCVLTYLEVMTEVFRLMLSAVATHPFFPFMEVNLFALAPLQLFLK